MNDPADGPAFVQGVDATLGTPEGGVVHPGEAQAAFDGIVAANGAVIDAGAIDSASDPEGFDVATISIAVVPVPSAAPFLAGAIGLLGLAGLRRRR